MDQHQQTLRVGAAAILCALALRFLGSGILLPAANWLMQPKVQSFLIYLETGRVVRFSPSLEENSNSAGESPAPTEPQTTGVLQEITAPVFSGEDASLLDIRYSCSLRPDLAKLLQRPLEWDLTGAEPTVLILHTHATESYTKNGEKYAESSAFRTLDEQYNMLSIGDAVAEVLTRNGIGVIHDRQLHDYPSYNGSYNHARKSIQKYLDQYPSIRLVLDLHRDASGDLSNQFRTVANVEGKSSAQLMLVMGTSAAGLNHPNWEENLALGVKLHAQLEKLAPGIMRPMSLRAQRFNQDMTAGSLLIEVGAAGNSHPEALLAAEILGEAIVCLAGGANAG
jgi:stage II sporulation protein P